MGNAKKKNLKGTKKFEKNHLKEVLERRKATAKIKQRHQLKEKQKTKRTRDAEFDKGPNAPTAVNGAKKHREHKVNDMSVDDFFQGGFEIPEAKPKRGKPAPKLGKRKRDGPEEGPADDDDDGDSGGGASDFLGKAKFAGADSDTDDAGADDADDAEADIGMSNQAMKDLAQQDPEFYDFLKENDPETLDFDEDIDLVEVDDLSSADGRSSDDDDDDKQQPNKKQKTANKSDKQKAVKKGSEAKPEDENELTRDMMAKWKEAMVEQHSLRATRQVVLAFRCAAHLNEVDEDSDRRLPRFKILSADVYNDILLLALREIPGVMAHHMPVKESASGKIRIQTGGKKSKVLPMLLKSYTASIMHLLSTLSDAETLKMTISGVLPILPYLLSFRKLIKSLIRSVANFWCQPASAESTRVTAYLVIRRLVVIGDRAVRETVLRTAYQGLIQGCRVTNPNTIQGINLMKNSAAELWGLDDVVSYTTAFNFIRQLAIHLRNSIVHNKNAAFRAVYNWQYTHSLDFWSCVLAENCSSAKEAQTGRESQLKLLVYPLVQITLGAMRLIPAAMYFPLRFQLLRSVLRISRATGTYIPMASDLLEILNSAEMRKPPKASTLKPLDFSMAYKAPKSYLRTRVYQDGVGDQVVELLGEYLVLWATNIAFPEFSLPVVVQLKRWLKLARRRSTGNKNQRLASALAVLLQKVEASARAVEDRRANVEFAPKDRAQVEAFMRDVPWEKTALGAYVVGQRKASQEKARLFEEARQEENRKRSEEEKLEALQASAVEGSEEEEDVEEEDDEDVEEEDDEDVEEEDDEEEEDEDEDEDDNEADGEDEDSSSDTDAN